MTSSAQPTALTGVGAFFYPAHPQRVHAAVLPHIRAVATILSKLEGVEVWRLPVLEGEDELVARAIGDRRYIGINRGAVTRIEKSPV